MTPTAPPAAAARDAFLAACRAADLFTPQQLAKAEAAVPPDAPTPVAAAWALIAAGLLTKFQAERLLAGRTDGFNLGPYTILDQVGRGATGRVYKARHRAMNRLVAVKVLAAEFTRTADDREALRLGVRAAAPLNHPNVVTAYDANELADRFYLVLEYIDGPDFEALGRDRGPLPVAEACELIRQAAHGLAHAHEKGMTHGGLKPTNLLVARPSKSVPEPLVKITDFGVARPGAGDPDFVAPEQARDPAAADPRADLYALGAVFYFLLAGRPPFPDGTAEEKLRRHQWEEPARIEAVRPDVPPRLAALVHQLLAKHPAVRPASAAEVAARLEPGGGAGEGMVCFELPAAQPGPYSFAAGQLSGGHPDAGNYPTPAASETSPWEQITVPAEIPADPGLGLEAIPGPVLRRRRGRRVSGGLVLAAAVAAAAIVGVVVKALAG